MDLHADQRADGDVGADDLLARAADDHSGSRRAGRPGHVPGAAAGGLVCVHVGGTAELTVVPVTSGAAALRRLVVRTPWSAASQRNRVPNWSSASANKSGRRIRDGQARARVTTRWRPATIKRVAAR